MFCTSRGKICGTPSDCSIVDDSLSFPDCPNFSCQSLTVFSGKCKTAFAGGGDMGLGIGYSPYVGAGL